MDAAYIAAIAVILLLPSVQMNMKRNLHVDNRAAEKFPDLSIRKLPGIPLQFEKWFGDRFGGRRTYIAFGNFILYHWFRESPNEQIAIGRNGFLFFTSHNQGVKNYNSLIKILFDTSPRRIKTYAEKFITRLPELERFHGKILFIHVPTKHLLYFDKMPRTIADTIPDSGVFFNSELIKEIIRRRPDAAKYFADLYSEALQAAPAIQLIPPRNLHWIPGPYTRLAANVIARRLGITDDVYIPKQSDFRAVETKSDLRYFMYKGLKTTALITSDEDFSKVGISSGEGISKRFKNLPNADLVDDAACRAVNPKARGGRVLLIGDSFTNPLCQDMARYCREVVSVEYSRMLRNHDTKAKETMRQLFFALNPEYVIVISHVNPCDWISHVIDMMEKQ